MTRSHGFGVGTVAKLAALLVACSTALLLGRSDQTSATPTPTFKSLTEYVEVDALVTDEHGAFVPGLAATDFEVFEDGKPQKIVSFAAVDLPAGTSLASRPASPAIEPDVTGNEEPFDGRLYVMVLDDLHVAALRSQQVKDVAKLFITQSLGANDLMAVVFTGGRSQDAQEFTRNKRLLIDAVDRFVGQKLQSLTAAASDEKRNYRDIPFTPPDMEPPWRDQLRAHQAQSMLSTVGYVSDRLRGVHGRRKTMLLFSEGIDYDITDIIRGPVKLPSAAIAILDDLREVVGLASRSNVGIYTIDPRGLSSLGDEAIELQQSGDRSLNREMRVQQMTLRQLSDDSGGLAFVNRNDYRTFLERVVSDNSSYYVLAYYAPSNKRDGKFHRIEVKSTRAGLSVRSRRGYVAARGKAPAAQDVGRGQELADALASPLPVSGLSIRVFAAPFKGATPNASVLIGVEMLGRDLTLAKGSLDLAYRATGAIAKNRAARKDTLSLDLSPDDQTRVRRSGVRVLNRIDVPPGRYQIRVAAHDSGTRKLGSVIYDLDVPDFHKLPFGISGLALSSLGSGALMTARADDQMRAVLPAAPVSQRTFAQNDELTLFAEIYKKSGRTSSTVDVVTTVMNDERGAVFLHEETLEPVALKDGSATYAVTVRVPLIGIAPGRYQLQLAATSTTEKSQGATQQLEVTIVSASR